MKSIEEFSIDPKHYDYDIEPSVKRMYVYTSWPDIIHLFISPISSPTEYSLQHAPMYIIHHTSY